MLVAHGAAFLRVKTEGVVAQRARPVLHIATLLSLALFVGGGYLVLTRVPGYMVIGTIDGNARRNPLNKEVIAAPRALDHELRDVTRSLCSPRSSPSSQACSHA